MKEPPKLVDIQGVRFKPVVMRVIEADDQGRPLLLRRYFEGDTVEFSEDETANRFVFTYGQIDDF